MPNGTSGNGLRKRKCARRGCKKRFKPTREWQKYCTHRCQNIDNQARLRARAKRTTELEAERGGAFVGGGTGRR